MNRIRFTLLMLLLALISCDVFNEPELHPRDNPFDRYNPETHGDPFHLQAVWVDSGVRLTWQSVQWEPLQDYRVYRRQDADTSWARLAILPKSQMTYLDRSAELGRRYRYYIAARGPYGETEPTYVYQPEVNTPPQLRVNDDTTRFVSTREVTLRLRAFGAVRMLVGTSSDFRGATWEPFAPVKPFRLSAGLEPKTIFARVVYETGDTSLTSSYTVTPAPINPYLQILPDSLFLNHTDVTLFMPNTGATEMKVANHSNYALVNWQPYRAQLSWELPGGDGWKRVYAWFRNDFFEGGPAYDSLGLDTRVGIRSFTWRSSTGSDTIHWRDIVSFTLETIDDAFGPETGGVARVEVGEWRPINLSGDSLGNYSASLVVNEDTPEFYSADVRLFFTDRAGNRVQSVAARRLSCERWRLWRTLTGHSRDVTSVAFSPSEALLASGSLDNTIRLWRFSDGSLVRTLTGHSSWVWSVAFSPGGALLASGSDDGTVMLWQVWDGALHRSLYSYSFSVISVAFSPGGILLASGNADNFITLWRVGDWAPFSIQEGHSGPVLSVAFSPDGNLLASGSADNFIKLWRVPDWALLRTLKRHSSNVNSVAFSPDGTLMASGSRDETVKLWRVSDGSLVRTLTGHSAPVLSVAFSPSGDLLASGGDDNTVKLWRVSDGALVRTLTGHSSGVLSVSFSPSGELLASGSADRTIKLWRR